MKTIIVDNDQASTIAKQKKGDTFTFLVLIKPQPPDGYHLMDKVGSKHKRVCFISDNKVDKDSYDSVFRELPHPVGSIVGVRESWSWKSEIDIDDFREQRIDKQRFQYLYKVNYSTEIGWQKKWHWLSPATMPSEAICSTYEITGNGCKRVQELTINEIIDILHPEWQGIRTTYQPQQLKDEFKQYFNAKYAHPRPVRKNGEIVSYVCYPYDDNSLNILWEEKEKLKIIANPYIFLCEGRKR